MRDLRADAAAAIKIRMEDLGWSSRETGAAPGSNLGCFGQRVDHEVTAIAFFPLIERKPRGIVVGARIGLEHSQARDLLVQLAAAPVSGIVLAAPTAAVRLPGRIPLEEAVEQLVIPYGSAPARVMPTSDLSTMVEMLRVGTAVPFIEKRMARYAYAVVEDGAGDPTLPAAAWEMSTALLVAAGRYEEAERYLSIAPEFSDGNARQRQRFTRQIRRAIGQRGQLLIPTSPPRWPVAGRALTSVDPATRLSTAYRRAKIERSAMDAVRVLARGRTHDELKARYTRELAARGIETSPGAAEEAADVLLAEQRRFGTIDLLAKLGKGINSLATTRTPGSAELYTPSSPERAAYPLFGTAGRWAPAQLDQSCGGFLEQLWRTRRDGIGRTRDIEVWLAASPSHEEDTVTVYIGPKRVGKIVDPADRIRFAPVLNAAAERDENPYAIGRLFMSKSSQSFALDVPLPEAQDP